MWNGAIYEDAKPHAPRPRLNHVADMHCLAQLGKMLTGFFPFNYRELQHTIFLTWSVFKDLVVSALVPDVYNVIEIQICTNQS